MTKSEIEKNITDIQKEIDRIENENKKLPELRMRLAYFAGRYDQINEAEKSKKPEEIKMEKCEQEECKHEHTGE